MTTLKFPRWGLKRLDDHPSRNPLPDARLFLSVTLALLIGAQSELFATNLGFNPQAKAEENSDAHSDENLAGVVPNSFGDLLTATGALNRQTLVFQNTTKEIRFVEVNGPKLQKTAYLFQSSSNNSARAMRESGSEWQDVQVGTIPERFGSLRGVFGERGSYNLIFENSDREIRTVPYAGNQLTQRCFLIQRNSERWSPPTKSKDRTRKTDDGWEEVYSGGIPTHFGALVQVTASGKRCTFIFQSLTWNDLYLIEFLSPRLKNLAIPIYGENPKSWSKEERKERRTWESDLSKIGWPAPSRSHMGWLPNHLGHLTATSGSLGEQDLNLIFQFEEDLRILSVRGKVSKSVEWIQRPEFEIRGKRKRSDGWIDQPIGELPNAFGELKSICRIGEARQRLLVLQNDQGEIRVIEMMGSQIPQRVTRIEREY